MINHLIFQPKSTSSYNEISHKPYLIWIPKPLHPPSTSPNELNAVTSSTTATSDALASLRYSNMSSSFEHNSNGSTSDIQTSLNRMSTKFLSGLAVIPPFSSMPELATYRNSHLHQLKPISEAESKRIIKVWGNPFTSSSSSSSSLSSSSSSSSSHPLNQASGMNSTNGQTMQTEPSATVSPFATSFESTRMASLLLPFEGSSDLIMFMHGNSSDCGESLEFLQLLRSVAKVNVIAVEYPGYGWYVDQSKPSEQAMFTQVVQAFDQLSRLKTIRRIIVVGYSLGTTAACEIGRQRTHHPKLKGIVLLAPFASVHKLISDFTTETYIAQGLQHLIPNTHFPNHSSIQSITKPLLIVHGTVDEIIPVSHSYELAQLNRNAQLIVVAGMTHNIHDARYERQIVTYLTRFAHRQFKNADKEDKKPAEAKGLFNAPVSHISASLWTPPITLKNSFAINFSKRQVQAKASHNIVPNRTVTNRTKKHQAKGSGPNNLSSSSSVSPHTLLVPPSWYKCPEDELEYRKQMLVAQQERLKKTHVPTAPLPAASVTPTPPNSAGSSSGSLSLPNSTNLFDSRSLPHEKTKNPSLLRNDQTVRLAQSHLSSSALNSTTETIDDYRKRDYLSLSTRLRQSEILSWLVVIFFAYLIYNKYKKLLGVIFASTASSTPNPIPNYNRK